MASTQDRPTGLLEPRPPALLPPWHTLEREALQRQARAFATDEVLPVADRLDPQKGLLPGLLLQRMAELGWFGITVPAEHGGLGLDVFVDLGVRCEEEASMVELEATEMAVRVTDQAVQLHGGNGCSTERQVERHWRDPRLTTILEGASEIQERITGDRLLPRSPLT